jgi:hypothetical protein
MSRVLRLSTIIAVVLCGAIGLAGTPALAKKNSGETVSVQNKKKKQNTQAKDCRKGPVPPFMRNPRYMNRGFLKKRC